MMKERWIKMSSFLIPSMPRIKPPFKPAYSDTAQSAFYDCHFAYDGNVQQVKGLARSAGMKASSNASLTVYQGIQRGELKGLNVRGRRMHIGNHRT
jgi:hypothetical protein